MNERERKVVSEALGDKVICRTCQATLDTFDEKCVAPLDKWCAGFDAIEGALGYPGGRQPVWSDSATTPEGLKR